MSVEMSMELRRLFSVDSAENAASVFCGRSLISSTEPFRWTLRVRSVSIRYGTVGTLESMSTTPSDEKHKPEKDLFFWFAVFFFWTAIAPTVFFAAFQVSTMPLRILLVAIGLSPDYFDLANVILAGIGALFAGWLLWLVWNQLKGYLANRAV